MTGLNALAEREEERTRLLIAVFALSLGNMRALRAVARRRQVRRLSRHASPACATLAREQDFGRSLVLIRGERHPDYARAAIYNPLDLEADAPIYAWDKNAEVRAALLAHYADRPIWVLAGPTRAGGGFEIVEGPLPPGTTPSR